MKVKLCPKCGKQNDENTWGCSSCGTTLPMNTLLDVDVPKSNKIRLCPHCGKQNDENAWNCSDCGATLAVTSLIDLDMLAKANLQKSKKMRLCLQCGKQNDENVWNCSDCGATLSINNIVDASNIEALQVDLQRKHALFSISKYFRNDYNALLDYVIQADESVVWGCDITKRSTFPPFWFGYVVLTSHRLLVAYFKADSERLYEDREYWDPETNQFQIKKKRKSIMIQPPDSELTGTEHASRRTEIFLLKDLHSVDISITDLTLKFQRSDKTQFDVLTITFFSEAQAAELYMPLREKLTK